MRCFCFGFQWMNCATADLLGYPADSSHKEATATYMKSSLCHHRAHWNCECIEY